MVFTTFQYCLFARSDTGTQLNIADVYHLPSGWHVTLRHLKGKKHTGHIKPLLPPTGAVPGLDEILHTWVDLQTVLGAQPQNNVWRLPWESRGTWPASLGDDWLQQALAAVEKRSTALLAADTERRSSAGRTHTLTGLPS